MVSAALNTTLVGGVLRSFRVEAVEAVVPSKAGRPDSVVDPTRSSLGRTEPTAGP